MKMTDIFLSPFLICPSCGCWYGQQQTSQQKEGIRKQRKCTCGTLLQTIPLQESLSLMGKPLKIKAMNTTKSIGSYYGSQSYISEVVINFLPKDRKAFRYMDVTSGGAKVPGKLRERGYDVVMNDFSYYAYLIAFATTVDACTLPWEEITPKEGYLFTKRILPFSDDTSRWIDGYIIKHEKSPLHLLAIAKAILTFYFRGMMPDLGLIKVIEPSVMRYNVYKSLKQVEHSLIERNETTGKGCASWDNALHFLQTYDVRDAILYTDPAWAFADGSECPAYVSYTNELTPILLQRDYAQQFWGSKDGEDAFHDVLRWVKTGLEKGAKVFIVNTQDTNAPNPKYVLTELKKLGYPVRSNIGVTRSGSQDRIFTEWWMAVGDSSMLQNMYDLSIEEIENRVKACHEQYKEKKERIHPETKKVIHLSNKIVQLLF